MEYIPRRPEFFIPDFTELRESICKYVKYFQKDKGYIDTQPSIGNDFIYALVYMADTLYEYVVYGIRYDEERDLLEIIYEPISQSYTLTYTEDDFKVGYWVVVGLHSMDIYAIPTLINIAEVIHEYVE